MARKESACIDALKKLRKLVRRTAGQGEISIPSERVLAMEFGVSRMTLRKAIDRALAENLVRKAGRGLVISSNTNPPTRTNLAFIASGIDVPGNHVWARVMHHLQETAKARNIAVTPCMIRKYSGPDTHGDSLSLALECDAAIIASGIKPEDIQEFHKNKTPVIALDENFADPAAHRVSLDNHAVGRLAAEYLLELGCRRMLFVDGRLDETYVPFKQRCRGFTELVENQGMTVRVMAVDMRSSAGANRFRELEKIAERAIRNHHDGIFLHSDEGLLVFMQRLATGNTMPNLVTVFGNGDLNDRDLPVTFIDHAEAGIAENVLNTVETVLAGDHTERLITHVRPKLHSITSTAILQPTGAIS